MNAILLALQVFLVWEPQQSSHSMA